MLHKLCVLLLLSALSGSHAQAQFVKEYRVAEIQGLERVNLQFSSYKSSTQLRRSTSRDPISLHGHLAQANILPDFRSSSSKNTLSVSLGHKNIDSDNLGKSITSKLFSSETGFDHSWDIGLSSQYTYALDFTLGMGIANFDLDQLSISTLKIKSASADVLLHYSGTRTPIIPMDTLLVTLNMGSVDLQQAYFTQAKKVIVEVNYGQINLDYSQGPPSKGQVIAAVGGGTLYLKLPSPSHPVILRMKTTPLCRTSLPDYLRAIGNDTFVTMGYSASDPRLLEFILEVGVGSLAVE